MTDLPIERVVYKFQIPSRIATTKGIFELPLPYLAQPLAVTLVNGMPVVYFLVRTDNPVYSMRLQAALTGRPLVDPDTDWKYIGTWVTHDHLVGHLFIDPKLGEPSEPTEDERHYKGAT